MLCTHNCAEALLYADNCTEEDVQGGDIDAVLFTLSWSCCSGLQQVMEVDCVRQGMMALPQHAYMNGCNAGAYERMFLREVGGLCDLYQNEQQGPCK